MAFHEVRFPTGVSLGASGGPELRTSVVLLASGHEERNAAWADSRRSYNAGLGLRSLADLDGIIAFFEARMGRLHGFRWKDWADYRSCLSNRLPRFDDQQIGVGDETRDRFSLSKTYQSGGQSRIRRIVKPVGGSVRVGVDGTQLAGTDFTLDTASGVLRLHSPPAAGQIVTAGFEFDVPVRFDTDQLVTHIDGFNAGSVPDIPVIELRL